ncbi:MAG: PA0069 family radical SAM protein [Pseudomonadota bacterium]
MQRRESPEQKTHGVVKGRGALENPAGRYERLSTAEAEDVSFPDPDEPEEINLRTEVFRDTSRSIVTYNDSPDIGMEATVNSYRGCEHGCIYCFARPYHEYLGLSAGLDFETKIFAKPDAPDLLRKKLSSPRWQPVTLVMSGITDPYQPLERKMKITRGCLEVLRDFRNPVAIITKNHLVTRDIDLYAELASYDCAAVNMSVTTLDKDLARKMEPRASTPATRLKAIEMLSRAGVPVNLMMGPILPGLTDHEIPKLLEAAANAGARTAAYTLLRLPYGVKDLFQTWLHEHFPDRAERVLNKVREMRDGKLNDPNFFSRRKGHGEQAAQIGQMFALAKKRYGLTRSFQLTTEHFRRDHHGGQLNLL